MTSTMLQKRLDDDDFLGEMECTLGQVRYNVHNTCIYKEDKSGLNLQSSS